MWDFRATSIILWPWGIRGGNNFDGYSEVYLFVLYFIFGNTPKSIEGNLFKFSGI